MKKFTCEHCKQEFTSRVSDEDAMKEFNEKYPECRGDMISIVCSDCIEKIDAWLNSLSMEEKLAMRQRMRAKWQSMS